MGTPRSERPGPSGGFRLLVNGGKVAVVLVLIGLLYLAVVRFVGSPSPVERIELSVEPLGGNWSVSFTSVPPGKVPSRTFLVIRNSTMDILLPRLPFENLTDGQWGTNRAVYRDGSPGVPELTTADLLLVDRSAYPPRSYLEITDEYRVLASTQL